MNSYIENNDTIAFHPGYYIKELMDESGMTKYEFSKKLDTTPEVLSSLFSGEQNLSSEMAIKLSKMTGTSIDFWLNLQKSYDESFKVM